MAKTSIWHTITQLPAKALRAFGGMPIITFSHLRWEFVVQRPQHIMTRLAKNHPVLFVEEPVPAPPNAVREFILKRPVENITVLTPHEPATESAVASYIRIWKSDKLPWEPLLWFYSPNFVSYARALEHSAIVYDCMDELSAFRGADPNLAYRESMLMTHSDVVFTGGISLYESKRRRHNNVYCFPSSVDRKHFARALDRRVMVPRDMKTIPRPIAGYVGVIDERIDLALLRSLAAAMPDISFVMIGPIAKIDRDSLPALPNIRYLGMKPYDKLPNYIKGLDIAIMPFAQNEATRYISPTKTPEFLSAMKPVVSTAVKDVMRTYREVVRIGTSVIQWKTHIRELLDEPDHKRRIRYKKQYQAVSRSSWDTTVHDMWNIITQQLHDTVREERRKLDRPLPLPSPLDYTI